MTSNRSSFLNCSNNRLKEFLLRRKNWKVVKNSDGW